MQEELLDTLRRVGIMDESVHLENVTLNREQNLLTVFFQCDREPAIELTQKLTQEIEKQLGGTRVRVDWRTKRASVDDDEPAMRHP